MEEGDPYLRVPGEEEGFDGLGEMEERLPNRWETGGGSPTKRHNLSGADSLSPAEAPAPASDAELQPALAQDPR